MALSLNIKKKYNDFLLDISFESSSNRIGILGASGCGKSLTLKAIAGLIKPDSGKIVFDNRLLFDADGRICIKPQDRHIGYLFQEYALFPNMTVEENISVAFKGLERKDSPGHIKTTLKKFGLWEIRDHYPHELSGGQKQRTALARMMASDPGLLLLDEPFSALDTFLREGMRLELIKLLNMYNKTVILVSHDRDEIYQMCNYLVIMEKGRVIDHGRTDELFIRPKTPVGARLTGCKNISRIQRLSDHRIRAIEWNGLELVTDEKVPEYITHAGIRAHDFIPGDKGINVVPTGQAMISRLPFEWYVTMENGLWWKLPRELDMMYKSNMVPQYVSVPPEKIILLKEEV